MLKIQMFLDCNPRGWTRSLSECQECRAAAVAPSCSSFLNFLWFSHHRKRQHRDDDSSEKPLAVVPSWLAFSQLCCVVSRKQAAVAPQAPLPPRCMRAVQHVDDVPGEEAQLVVLLRSEVVERLHQVCPLQDSRGTAAAH